MKKISFVIPCYRSESTLGSVIEEIQDKMRTLNEFKFEIVLINDCSPDNTFGVISSYVEKYENIIGISLAKNSGQHAALMAGFRHCSGDYIVCLDDDGQTPANEVDKLISELQRGFDVVYASYDNKKHSPFRNFGSKLNSKMTERMLEKPKSLFISSYFIARRFVVDEMIKYEGCYPYVIGLVLRSTKNISNVSVTHRQRSNGTSGYSISKLFGLWLNGFTSFSIKPLRFANYIGCFSAILGFVYALWIVIRHFILNIAPPGWSSTMSLILILGGIVLMVLGMIGEYIGRIYMCINSTPQYIIREVVTNTECRACKRKNNIREK